MVPESQKLATYDAAAVEPPLRAPPRKTGPRKADRSRNCGDHSFLHDNLAFLKCGRIGAAATLVSVTPNLKITGLRDFLRRSDGLPG